MTNFSPSLLSQYSDFVFNHPNGNVFQTIEMYNVYRHSKNHEPVLVIATNTCNDITGVLLAVIQTEHNGFLGSFTARSIIWGGPLVKDNDLEVLDYILKEYNRLIKNKVIYTQFRNLWEWSFSEHNVFKSNGFLPIDHLDIIHDLSYDSDIILMNMNQGRRKNIKRAIKQNVIFEEISNREEFLSSLHLIVSTYNRIKLPLPDKTFFCEVYNELQHKGMLKIFKVSFLNKMIGVRFVLCYKSLIYDWYAGASESDLDKYPNDLLPYKVMEWGHVNGYKFFDFGGAGKPNKAYGVRDYKLKFGGTLVNYGRYEAIHQPIKMSFAKTVFKGYRIIKGLFS